jgi:flagellar hook-associated protein 2
MAIAFGGLATGLDTNSIIEQLMNAERAPLVRLEADKTWMNNRLSAFTELDARLKSFASSIANLGDKDQLQQRAITSDSSDYFTASVDKTATLDTNYQIDVISLAQVEKDYSDTGYASKSAESFSAGTITINVDGTDQTIDITTGINNTLDGIMRAINDADIGVSASIVNDGDPTNPYRLTITGDTVGQAITISDDTVGLGTFTESQPATQAHIQVDGLDIYSSSNTVTEAIPGVTLNLVKADSAVSTKVSIALDNSSIKGKINAFATGYNDVVSFISSQSTIGDTKGGVLSGDSGINAMKRHLQDWLTTQLPNSSSFSSISQLGLETQKDGTLKVNDTILSAALDSDIDSVVSLLSGPNGDDGIAATFQAYLESQTSSTDGMLAGRESNITSGLSRIDDRIEQMEMRLGKREETMRKQFNAMELLVSSMNAQSDYLTQALSGLENLWKR